MIMYDIMCISVNLSVISATQLPYMQFVRVKEHSVNKLHNARKFHGISMWNPKPILINQTHGGKEMPGTISSYDILSLFALSLLWKTK